MSASTSDWEPPLPEELQRMLPQYEITGIIGRGGMGAVYQGRQAKLNRKVAIKLLPETFTQGDDELNFAKRFEQEAQAMAGLDHPAIISVYDFGETPSGQLYFVMEFIDGMDIHEYLKHHGGRLPQEHALSITAHVLDALEYAHQHGIVHRDIKPANILLNREGRVKIADFGLAKKFGEHADESAPALTMSNVAVGTPDFVAPEALDPGAKPDHRADLYAVGVMLYQMLTGKLPRGNFRLPSEMQPEIDPRLDVIVGKAMEADPDHRYASASAVRADLDRVLSQPMQRIEPGAESYAVPAAVPVTLSVKGGGQAPGVARRGSPAGTKPARPGAKADPAPAKGGNTGLIVGLSVAAAVVLGLGLFWLFGTGRGQDSATGFQTGASADKTPASPSTHPAVSPKTTTPGATGPAIVAKNDTPPQVKASPSTVQTPKTFPPGQWVKLDGSPSLNDLAVMPDGWLSPMSSTFSVPGVNGSNHGIRWVTRMVSPLSGNDAHFLSVRHSSAEKGTSAYQALVSASQKSFSLRYDSLEGKNATILKNLAESLQDGSQFSIEFAAVGDKLVCRMNGKLLTVAADSNLKSGGLAFRNIFPVRDIEVINLDGLPETEALNLLGVDANGNDSRASSLTNADPPPTPVPAPQNPSPSLMPTPNPAPAAPTTPPTPAPSPAPDPTIARLAALPGLKTRLDGYLTARTKQIGDLAVKYLGGLQTRLDQAANAGDLKLATAFQAETARVEALQKAIAIPPADALSAATDAAITALPDLPEGSPEPLIILRQTWTTESAKIRAALDAALQQSLQALEAELTKAREFENAHAVLAYREALSPSKSAAVAPQPPSATPTSPTPTTPTPSPNKPGLKDLTLALATKEKPYENSLGMKFVPVPDTDVLFCIHEVRYKDYAAYAKEVSGVDKGWQNQTLDGFTITDRPEDHPVVTVRWDDAQAFCAWLSKKEGKTFRLPTDREWSVAVGIGREEKWKDDTTPATVFKPRDAYPWGDRWPPPKGAGNYGDESRNAKAPVDNASRIEAYDDGFPTTAPVMSFEANKLGLFDLGGNVWEWCEDWHDNAKTDRVLRGGAFDGSYRFHLLSSHRNLSTATRLNYCGFRIVVETSAPTTITTPVPAASPAPPSATRPSSVPDPALARATKDAPFENTLGMKFVPVPGTDVLFCIHETRYRDYATFSREVDGVAPDWKNQTHDGFAIQDSPDDHPVVQTSWDDAQAFCSWLSKNEGKTYRLPTDREWGIAVGIGREEDWRRDTTPATVNKPMDAFPWGKDWPPPKGAGNYSDQSRKAKAPNVIGQYIDGYDDGFPTTAPVMSFAPNKLGLFDLGGNAWEWCEDWHDDAKAFRVLRGGSWQLHTRSSLFSSHRLAQAPEKRHNILGFRVVLVVSPGG